MSTHLWPTLRWREVPSAPPHSLANSCNQPHFSYTPCPGVTGHGPVTGVDWHGLVTGVDWLSDLGTLCWLYDLLQSPVHANLLLSDLGTLCWLYDMGMLCCNVIPLLQCDCFVNVIALFHGLTASTHCSLLCSLVAD